jgi:hypothetical protein
MYSLVADRLLPVCCSVTVLLVVESTLTLYAEALPVVLSIFNQVSVPETGLRRKKGSGTFSYQKRQAPERVGRKGEGKRGQEPFPTKNARPPNGSEKVPDPFFPFFPPTRAHEKAPSRGRRFLPFAIFGICDPPRGGS